MSAAPSAAGLAGVVAGETAISTVGKEGKGLTYRGYSIYELAEQATFEEVAFLLLYGQLPTQSQLAEFLGRLKQQRWLPDELQIVLEQLPATAHPMDVMRTGCSVLGCVEPEDDFGAQHRVAERLLATFPSMLLYWHRFHSGGQRIETGTGEDSIAEHFLRHLTGATPTPCTSGRWTSR